MSDVRKSDFGLAGQIEPRVAIANSLRMLHTEKLAFLPNPWRFLLEAPSAASRIVIAAKNRVFQQYRPKAEVRPTAAVRNERTPGHSGKSRLCLTRMHGPPLIWQLMTISDTLR